MRFLVLPFLMACAFAQDLRYTAAGELIRPPNYREWIFLSSGLGMTYGTVNPDRKPMFDNVYVNPSSYREFIKTGHWPDKTIFVLEIRTSETNVSINNGGHTQGAIVAIEASVKDESRFPEKWAYFDFGSTGTAVKALPKTERCFQCHSTKAALENTFVQFYPTLMDVAKAKRTVNEGFGK